MARHTMVRSRDPAKGREGPKSSSRVTINGSRRRISDVQTVLEEKRVFFAPFPCCRIAYSAAVTAVKVDGIGSIHT